MTDVNVTVHACFAICNLVIIFIFAVLEL